MMMMMIMKIMMMIMMMTMIIMMIRMTMIMMLMIVTTIIIIIHKNQLKHDNIRCLTWILLKYCPASKGTTLYVETPVIGSSVGFVAV